MKPQNTGDQNPLPPENPYQILGNWHIQRGCIMYLSVHRLGIEMITSTGLSLRVEASEATKIPCTLNQLASLICQGMDLPMLKFRVSTSRSMIPDCYDVPPKNLAAQFMPPPAGGGASGSASAAAQPKPKEEDSDRLRGHSGYNPPEDRGGGGRSK